MKKFKFPDNFWENFILVSIFLVVIQTFLDDYSHYALWSVKARNILLITGFFFDLTFTIEFIVRSILAIRKKEFKLYFLYRRGWVDFLASIPLLLLNSGPSLYFLIRGYHSAGKATIGVLNVLKIVKAIRITRILRLIRIMKIFGKIHNAESKMAQRHTATIATTGVFTIVIILIIFSFFRLNLITNLYNEKREHYTKLITNIENINMDMDVPLRLLTFKLLSNDKNILKMYYINFLIFSNISEDKFQKYYAFDDYLIIKENEFKLYVDVTKINKEIASVNLENFFIIIFLVIAYMIFYTKHFVQTISDIVYIMYRGFTEDNYNLQIKIKKEYKEDEIYKLAEVYNDKWLPLKLKLKEEEKKKKESKLSIDDLLNFKV